MTNQPAPETARALLWRHGLPEDVVDGALCLHAQELAALQRLRMDELDLTGQKARIVGRVVDLIDPTLTPAAPAEVAPSTDQAALRDRIAAALWAAGGPAAAEDANVDAVLSVLPASTDRGAVLEEAADRLGELRIAEREWLVGCGLDKGEQELRRVADETRNTTEALRPATTEWTFEACYDADNDKWHGIGGTYSDHAEAKDAFKRRAENDPDHVKHFKFRLVRSTTAYTVEAEHTPPATPPAGGAQQAKETRP